MNAIYVLASLLDRARAALLQLTCSVPVLRSLFLDRASRLGILFAFNFLLSLALAMLFPLWVLALGPFVYGVPHLFASLRYFHYRVSESSRPSRDPWRLKRRSFLLLSGLMLATATYRLLFTLEFVSEWQGTTYLDLGALVVAFIAGAKLYRKPVGAIGRGSLLLLPLSIAFVWNPPLTIGALILIHNFVGYFYWSHAARSPRERAISHVALLAFSIASGWILFGGLDWAGSLLPAGQRLPFSHFGIEEVGKLIAPSSSNPTLWLRLAVTYAFGQSMHYFVWLKATPDQHHSSEMPTSFRQSARLLEEDFGKRGLWFVAAFCVLTWAAWMLMEFPKARAVYFALAGFHGYLEIAGLALAPVLHRQRT